MADFSALVNELKQNNQSEETRDQRRLNQATAHNQDQQERFIGIAEVLAESSEKTSAGLQAVVDGQPQQLSPTQELENKRAEMNLLRVREMHLPNFSKTMVEKQENSVLNHLKVLHLVYS